jgi:sensor histidine kinase regulating citrate/malate metabolism
MPKEVQLQIFQRSFSTKAQVGRGIGTYSIKLFAEQYLGGKVYFTSQEPDGTSFVLSIPKNEG